MQKTKLLQGKFSINTYILFTMRTTTHWNMVALRECGISLAGNIQDSVWHGPGKSFQKEVRPSVQQNSLPNLFHTVFYFCYSVEVHFLRHPWMGTNLLEANIIEEAGLKLTRRETESPFMPPAQPSCLLHPNTLFDLCFCNKIIFGEPSGKGKSPQQICMHWMSLQQEYLLSYITVRKKVYLHKITVY